MNRTDRLMAMLLEFQARRELRAEDLARRFEVSVRTVYRDVQALSEGGVPIAALPGKGYRLLDGYFLPPLSFTADEAAVLALGGAFVRDRVDAELRQAAVTGLAKLRGVLPPERAELVARRRRELVFPDFGQGPDEPTLSALRAAVEDRRVVRLLYHARRRPAPEAREVEPVSLVYAGDGWLLAAYCRLRQAPRFFRLARIDRLEPLGERFELAERHIVDANAGRHLDAAEARVRFAPSALRWVRERQPFPFLREEADPSDPIFVYALQDESELVAWLLGWGTAVEVLDPVGLRRRIAAEARAIVARYAADRPDDRLDDLEWSAAMPDMTLSGALP